MAAAFSCSLYSELVNKIYTLTDPSRSENRNYSAISSIINNTKNPCSAICEASSFSIKLKNTSFLIKVNATFSSELLLGEKIE